MSIHATYHANFIETTDMVQQMQQFKVHFSSEHAVTPCHLLSKSVNPLWRYHDFSNFFDGSWNRIGFLKISIFIGICSPSGGLSCINVPNFVKIGQSLVEMLQFFYFKIPATILDFRNSQIVVSEGVQRTEMHHLSNFIKIQFVAKI